MSSVLYDIESVFSYFQDGEVVGYEQRALSLVLNVSCPYLAKCIDPGFSRFEVEVFNLKKFGFEPWVRESAEPQGLIQNHADIFRTKMEIFDAEKSKGHVKVFLRHADESVDNIGGILRLTADEVVVRQHNGEVIELETLKAISEAYWKEFNEQVHED